jgi:NAD(P)-dependent dehydrogenase (short-subunit alcohol dehydrogenase family)
MPNVLITGTSTGIGLETALEFARRGFDTIATMRNLDKRSELESKASDENLSLRFESLDVTDPASALACIERVGQIDVLVNNAGVAGAAPLELVDEAQHKQLFEANYFGPLRLVQIILPQMRAREAGTIVNVTSLTGRIALPNQIPYSASKWALESASEALAHEVARFGIKVRIIEPGIIMTNIFENAAEATVFDKGSPYLDVMRRNGKMYAAGMRTGQLPDMVARSICDAVECKTNQLRFVVGADAQSFIAGRDAISDEDWVAMGEDLTDERYNELFEARFGMKLK